MSQRVPGHSQQDMIALWKAFVRGSFQATKFKTTFKGATRPVYRDGERLLVLDEYHGDLEVLALQASPGPARHLGSQEINVVYERPPSGGRPVVRRLSLGAFHPGGKHEFVLTGSL